MKDEKITFDFSGAAPSVRHNGQAYPGLLAQGTELVLEESRFAAQDLNLIGVPECVYTQHGQNKMLLINPVNDQFITVKLRLRRSLPAGSVLAAAYVKDTLGAKQGDKLLLCPFCDLAFHRFLTQRIDNIRENNLVLSSCDYREVMAEVQESPCSLFEVYNTVTMDSLVVQKSHILVDETLEPGTIRLNRKQRIGLGLELPAFLTEEQWERLTGGVLRDRPEDEELIRTLYGSEDHILAKDASYRQKMAAKKITEQHCRGELRIIPVMESFRQVGKRSLWQRIIDFYVGKSTISLVGRRPYDIDEGSDIVRITKANINLLGLDEMDKVILQYKNKKIRCRVLALDDERAFFETNLPIETDLAIGIPVHLRKKLGLPDLTSAVKVDRDTWFIFKKSINEQVIPILLTLFSTKLFSDASPLGFVLLSVIAIPIVLYLNLSSKRNMRA